LDSNLAVVTLFGGVYLLLYGIRMAGEGVQRASGGKLRETLAE